MQLCARILRAIGIKLETTPRLRLERVLTHKEQHRGWESDRFEGIAFSPDGKNILTAFFTAFSHDVASGRLVKHYRSMHLGEVLLGTHAISRDCRWLLTITKGTPQLHGLDLIMNGGRAHSYAELEGAHFLTFFSPDSGKVVCFSRTPPVLYVFGVTPPRARDPSLVVRCTEIDPRTQLAFSPDSRRLLVGRELWDIESAQKMWSADDYTAQAFSADGSLLILGKRDGVVDLFNPNTGRVVDSVRFGGSSATSSSFSPDGRAAVIGDSAGNVHVLDIDRRVVSVSRTAHNDAIFLVKYSPEQDYILTCGKDKRAYLWNPHDLSKAFYSRAPAAFRHGLERIKCIEFLPSGSRRILIADGRIAVVYSIPARHTKKAED